MAQIFLAFLLTSLVGTGFALVLALLKPITRKQFSSGWHYYMWLVALIVMMLPIRLDLPQMPKESPSVSQTIVYTDNHDDDVEIPIVSNIEQETIIQEQEIILPKTSVFQTVKDFAYSRLNLIGYIWFGVAILIFFIKMLSYMIFLLKVRKDSVVISCPELKAYTKRKVTTRVSDTICSPLIIGLFRPILLLPKAEITKEQLQNVLVHETTHLKRKDILYKWFVSVVKCVHWFNPAIYFISKQINIDCEISCDLAVVKEMDEQQEKGYVETILALLTHNNSKTIPLTTGMTGNKKNLKKRFIMIKDKFRMNKKSTIISIVVAIALLISAIVISGLMNGNIFNSFDNTAMDIRTDDVNGNNFNVLFVGLDNNYRADTIMVIKVQNGSILGLSIPRDTVFKDKRISDILASENGDQLAVDTIKKTLSVPIHYYAKLDLIAIKEVVDAVGGVDFDVPMNMVYDDPYQELHINLKQGRHTLDGEGVCQLLQFRRGYPEGDLTRIEIGQQFVKEFISQKLNKENINKLPKIFKAISENVQTNYPISNFKRDIQIISAIKSDNITFDTVAGRVSTYNYMPVYELSDSSINAPYSNSEQQKSQADDKLKGNTQKVVRDPPNSSYLNDKKVTVIDIGCDDIEDTDYFYDYFNYEKYDFDRKNNLTLSQKDGTISFYYKNDKKQSIGVKLVEKETGDVDAEYTITPEPSKIYKFNGLKRGTTYEIVLDGQINEPVYIVYKKYGEYIAPAPPVIQEDGIGFSQIVFEKDTSIKDIESDLKKSGKAYTVSDYSYKDSLSSTKSNITCDKNGNISVFFDINAENLVDITFKDSSTKKEVAKFGILANDVNSYSFTGFDKNKKYDVVVQGKTKNNWKIEGQYIIF